MNTFDQFSRINLQRANRWHHGDIREWTASDWAVATGGEMGELLNAIKKLRRLEIKVQGHDGDTPQPLDTKQALKAIAKEIGDVYTYLDILTQFFGLRMWDCVRDTFNAISVREGMPERMPVEFAPAPDVAAAHDVLDNLIAETSRARRDGLDADEAEQRVSPLLEELMRAAIVATRSEQEGGGVDGDPTVAQ